jgi:acetyl esterase/lipase
MRAPATIANDTWSEIVGTPAPMARKSDFVSLLFLLVPFLAFSPCARGTSARVIELWPEGVPGLRADASEERVVDGRIENIHRPTLTMYAPPAEAATGAAVIVCPGGGYRRLAIFPDGGPEVRWLTSIGVTAFVLKYRLQEYGHPAPLRDVLRAIRLVRSRAAELGVRPDRVGLVGTSAGGHLAACASTLWDSAEGRGTAPVDEVNARPDFAILVYPVVTMREPFVHRSSRTNLLGSRPSPGAIDELSIELRVRGDMPPLFIVAAATDASVHVENSLQLYRALHANGVPAELHVYAAGIHGDSHAAAYGPTSRWPDRATEWLRFHGWLRNQAP